MDRKKHDYSTTVTDDGGKILIGYPCCRIAITLKIFSCLYEYKLSVL